jgi:hypothetical protein
VYPLGTGNPLATLLALQKKMMTLLQIMVFLFIVLPHRQLLRLLDLPIPLALFVIQIMNLLYHIL